MSKINKRRAEEIMMDERGVYSITQSQRDKEIYARYVEANRVAAVHRQENHMVNESKKRRKKTVKDRKKTAKRSKKGNRR